MHEQFGPLVIAPAALFQTSGAQYLLICSSDTDMFLPFKATLLMTPQKRPFILHITSLDGLFKSIGAKGGMGSMRRSRWEFLPSCRSIDTYTVIRPSHLTRISASYLRKMPVSLGARGGLRHKNGFSVRRGLDNRHSRYV